jgi:hypothetical protein
LFGVFQAEGRVAEPDRTIIGDGQIIGRIEPLALRPGGDRRRECRCRPSG